MIAPDLEPSNLYDGPIDRKDGIILSGIYDHLDKKAANAEEQELPAAPALGTCA